MTPEPPELPEGKRGHLCVECLKHDGVTPASGRYTVSSPWHDVVCWLCLGVCGERLRAPEREKAGGVSHESLGRRTAS